ncbi:MAG: CPBP family intramembrane glutamic endopeptidase [Gemmatimonadota bacterium]
MAYEFLSVRRAGKLTAMSDVGKRVPGAGAPLRMAAFGGLLIAIAWLLTDPLPLFERAFATFLLGVLPVALLMTAGPATVPEGASRHAIYASSWGALWVLAAIALAVVPRAADATQRLALVWPETRLFAGWTLLLIVAGVVVVLLWRAFGHREGALSMFLLPRSGTERLHYAWLSLTAGFTEEVVFRGFLVRAVEDASGSALTGVAVAAVAFGLAHRYQGASGAVRAGVLGAILSAPLLVIGSIVPAIIAHSALDLLAGLWWRERLLGETLEPHRSSL